MVYSFAKQSNGHVTIESEEGRGTTVSLCWPQKEGSVAKEEGIEEQSELSKGGGETILVVEDDPNVREVTVDLLDLLGYKVIEAANGQDGLLALAINTDVELLLTDVVLPGGMNGVELRKEAGDLWPNLSSILISGYTDLPDGELPEDALLLNKPVSRNQLAEALRAAL